MIAISVIIPVYNTEKYITECIESLLNQTLENCEFIFVNDGSKDKSQSIIESYQEKDSRIILINQENQGVSVARNNGIAIAKGEYIGFVDGDDYVDGNYFEAIYETFVQNTCDIVIANYSSEKNGVFEKQNLKFDKNKTFNKAEIISEIIPEFVKSSSLNSVWNKVFKKSILDGASFPEGIALGEDGIFCMKTFYNSSNIIFIDNFGYYYREVQGSATKNIAKKDYFKRALEVYNFDYNFFFNNFYTDDNINKWRSIKLISNVISYIDVYLKFNNGLSFFNKIEKIKNMISSEEVIHCIKKYKQELISEKSKYEKFIINSILNQSLIKIILANFYSQIRNK